MPFLQRIIEPTHVSRVEVGSSVKNELECVTNHTLANIIRQLSSLSTHAEDMFSELYRDTKTFFDRASQLNSRVEHLRLKVTQLNPTEEIVSLQDINRRKPFQASNQNDQQVVSRSTIPRALLDTYRECDRPPPLDKLNPYRDDGKDCMKYYTDPSYFVELWFANIKKDIDTNKLHMKAKRGKRRPKQEIQHKVRAPKSKKEDDRVKALDVEFREGYGVPVIKRTEKAVPTGYTRQTSVDRPAGLAITGQTPDNKDGPRNHADRQTVIQNGPYNGPQYNVEQHNQTNYEQHGYRPSQRRSNAQLNQNHMPGDNRTSQRASNLASPNRPLTRPPPPPEVELAMRQGDPRMVRDSMSPNRESLPPPPPPPPLGDDYSPPGQQQMTPQAMRNPQVQRIESPGNSPLRQVSPMRDDLPPPPPPPMDTPGTPDMPPPPPPPPSLQPMHSPVGHGPVAPMMNGHLVAPGDNMSEVSEDSTETASSIAEAPVAPEPDKPTARSALLDEIRLGNRNLNKTDDRKRGNAAPKDKFDVHAVMARAFDVRRRAIEESDSEDDSDEEEDGWED